jgi:histidine triad (HIT) family protein
MSCVFCEIIQGKIPAWKLYEDDRALAILDHRPVRQGHAVILPKVHIDHFIELDEDLAAHLFRIGKTLGLRIQETLTPKRIGYAIAGFGVPHAHFNIIPMWGNHDITSSQYAEVNDGILEFSGENVPIADDREQADLVKLLRIPGI